MGHDEAAPALEEPDTAPTPRRTPNKVELRRIKRQVASLRKQGETLLTDEELERQGFLVDSHCPIPTAPEASAPDAAPEVQETPAVARTVSPSRAVSAPPERRKLSTKQMRRNGSKNGLAGMPRNGSSSKSLHGMSRVASAQRSLSALPDEEAQLRPLAKAELRKIKQSVASRRRSVSRTWSRPEAWRVTRR